MSPMEKQSVKEWIRALQGVDPKSKNAKVAARILRLASLPRRKRVVVDLNKLDRYAKAEENVVVPGKILGTGSLEKALHISAIDLSEASEKKLKSAGCNVLGLNEMLKKENVRVIM